MLDEGVRTRQYEAQGEISNFYGEEGPKSTWAIIRSHAIAILAVCRGFASFLHALIRS